MRTLIISLSLVCLCGVAEANDQEIINALNKLTRRIEAIEKKVDQAKKNSEDASSNSTLSAVMATRSYWGV